MNPLARLFDVIGDVWRTIIFYVRDAAISAGIGLLPAVWAARGLGGGVEVMWVLTLVFGLIVYLVWCQLSPLWPCPRCQGQRYVTLGRGHMRDRNCRRCGGKGVVRRLGAGAGA